LKQFYDIDLTTCFIDRMSVIEMSSRTGYGSLEFWTFSDSF